MFKKLLLVSSALVACSASAFAADLPSRRAPPVYVPPLPMFFTWSGSYVGVTAGYAFDTDHSFRTVGNAALQAANINAGVRPGYVRERSSGFTGGGEIGYNYQFMNSGFLGGNGGIVVGVEADAQYVGPGHTDVLSGTTGALNSFHSRTDYVGTVRGRLGYGFDRFLVYGTGGFAYGGVHDNVNFAGAVPFTGGRSTMRTGYAYGGGMAYALPVTSFVNFFHSSAVTLKAEFIRYDLGRSSVLLAAPTGASYTSTVRTTGNLVRAGIDYKFDLFGGGPVGPVVAKY
jgi:outer membrane immunogenic protein